MDTNAFDVLMMPILESLGSIFAPMIAAHALHLAFDHVRGRSRGEAIPGSAEGDRWFAPHVAYASPRERLGATVRLARLGRGPGEGGGAFEP